MSSANINHHQSEGGGRGYHHAGPSHVVQAPEGAPLPRQGPVQRVAGQRPGSASHRRSIAATTAAVVSAVAISITFNQREGGRRGYHHAGPLHENQAPEGAPLPRQGPLQRVAGQRPGSASHRRSRAVTTAAVVSAVAISITINQERRGGGRGYHHAGPSHVSQAPKGAPLPRQGPVQRVVGQVPGSASHRRSRAATAAAVVSAVATSITFNQRGGGEDIIMRGPHIFVRLPRALHSRGRVPSREFPESDLEVRVIGGAEQQQQQQWCQQWQYQSPSIRGGGERISSCGALTAQSGSRGRSTPEAGSPPETSTRATWKCES